MMQYHEYRQCDCEWINEIPAHWGTVSIKRTVNSPASSFIDGDWIESDVITSDGIRYLTTGNVGAIDYKEQGSGFISEETFRELNCTEVFPGDILISRLNEPIGRACIVPDLGYRIVVAVDNVIYRPNNELYDNKFLVYQMNCLPYAENANFIARGSTMPRISRTMLGSIKICVPPLIEQKKIASYLDKKCDKINSAIDTQKKKIELLNELKQTIITNAVTRGLNPDAPMKDSGAEWIGKIPKHWKLKRLKYISTIKGRIGFRGYTVADLVPEGEGAFVIGGKHINQCVLNTDSPDYISWDKYYESPEIMVAFGDIVMAQRGSLGKVAIIDKEIQEATINPSLVLLKEIKCNNKYLYNYLVSRATNTLIELLNTATAVPMISQNQIENMPIPLAPPSEQLDIVKYIDEQSSIIDAKISKTNRRIELLNELKQSIIVEAVTGKIKVC